MADATSAPSRAADPTSDAGDGAHGDSDPVGVARDTRFPLRVQYCPCGLPPEYCEFLPEAELKRWLPWLQHHCPALYGRGTSGDTGGGDDDTDDDTDDKAGKATSASRSAATTATVESYECTGRTVDAAAIAGTLARVRLADTTESPERTEQRRIQQERRERKQRQRDEHEQRSGTGVAEAHICRGRVKGNKAVTTVYGLPEVFAQQSNDKAREAGAAAATALKEVAQACKKRFGCGATVTRSADKRDVVEVQGDRLHDVATLLRDRYAVPSEALFVFAEKRQKERAFPDAR